MSPAGAETVVAGTGSSALWADGPLAGVTFFEPSGVAASSAGAAGAASTTQSAA
jgi:hypothetical protein